MYMLRHILYALFYFAVACLVLNDAVRLICPAVQQSFALASGASEQEEDNNPVNSISILEEEVKHHNHSERLQVMVIEMDAGLDLATEHLIKDDEVRHLAFIPIFTPPPDHA